VETFFGHALRGSGLNGLSSMREIEGNIIRPLLNISHEVLKKYANENNLEWREDVSNASDDYQRNRIRHYILPTLNEVSETWSQGIKNTFENLENECALLSSFVKDWAEKNCLRNGNAIKINLDAIAAQRAASSLLYHFLGDVDSGFNWHALANAYHDAVGSFYYGKTHRALRDRDWLIVAPIGAEKEAPVEISSDTTHIKHPLQLRFSFTMRDEHTRPEIGIAGAKIYFNPGDALLDAEKLKFPLTLRPWQEGDKFVPLGMKGTKLVSDYLIDAKIPRSEKEKTMVLISDGKIVWLVGHRISELYKVGAETQIMYLARPLKVEDYPRE
jgi:tRNA(Ile)-lysidine synthase